MTVTARIATAAVIPERALTAGAVILKWQPLQSLMDLLPHDRCWKSRNEGF